ncbi:MAG: TRAP transporter large permease subunit [Alphaproteobacteria bacterium]
MTPDEWLAIAMLASFFGLLVIGVPVAVGIALSGFVFGYIGFGDLLFNMLPARIYGVVTKYEFMAIPLFVFMGVMLERSRVAEQMLEAAGLLAGPLRGGMGIAIIVVGVLLGASTGIVGATVVTMTLLTLPVLIRRGYAKSIASGAICASGTLGQIIPPSLVLILLADIIGLSVGTLFAAAMLPGLVLAGLYVVFIIAVGMVRPELVPALPRDERERYSRGRLAAKVAWALGPPLALVLGVLGSIIGGLAAPTEAAAVGAALAVVIAALYGRLTARLVVDVADQTVRVSAMIFFILIAAQVFSLAFRGLRGDQVVADLFAFLPGGADGAVVFMLMILFVLGFFLEWIEISYIALPLFLPVLQAAGIDMVWLAILVAMNLQTSFLTPPFGWALFFLKGAAPPEVTTGAIYKGVLPFIALQILGLAILFFYPPLATWLPDAIGW